MSRFEFITTPLHGVKLVQRSVFTDARGFLSRFFCSEEFANAGIDLPISQLNHTQTLKAGAVRGLHFQHPPFAEIKLISCIVGEVWDVAVDLRYNSPTFLQWHGEYLSAANRRSMYIPEGFAHGFQTLTDNCELVYLHSRAYKAESEGALHALDPRLNITWPLPITEISEKDRNHKSLEPSYAGLTL